MNVLVVDDEKEIAALVEVILRDEGHTVYKTCDPTQAMGIIEKVPIDIGILDVMMPALDGFTLCRQIRERYTFPIIMLTARIEDVDKITGLASGADDYVTKPFNPLELIARVRAQLRRANHYNAGLRPSGIYDHNGLCIDPKTHTCTLFDKPIQLTPTEFKILWLLCENAGNVVSSEDIFESVWGEEYLDSNNTVMVHIRRIREKLKEPSRNPRYIKTVWGVGYKVEKSDS